MRLSGMSAKLVFLHSEMFDLSRTRLSENDPGTASAEVAKDRESSFRPIGEQSEMSGNTELVIVRSDGEAQAADSSFHTHRKQVEDFNSGSQDIDSQGQTKTTDDVEELKISQHEPLEDITEMETEGGTVEVADAIKCSTVNGLEPSSSTDPVSEDIRYMTADFVVRPVLTDKSNDASASLQMDVSCMSPDNKSDTQMVEGAASVVDISNGKAVDAIEIVENDVGIRNHVESDSLCPANVKASLASECNIETFENGNQPLEDSGNDKLEVVNDDAVLPKDLGCEEKDPTSSFMCSGEVKTDSTPSVEVLGVSNAALLGEENIECHEADPQIVMDREIPAPDHPGVEDCRVSCRPFSLQVERCPVNDLHWNGGFDLIGSFSNLSVIKGRKCHRNEKINLNDFKFIFYHRCFCSARHHCHTTPDTRCHHVLCLPPLLLEILTAKDIILFVFPKKMYGYIQTHP